MSDSKLTAENLKGELWSTLEDLRSGNMKPGHADAIASQSREILRTVNTQLRIFNQANRPVTADVIAFAEK